MRRDSDLLAQEGEEPVEIEGGIDGDLTDGGLRRAVEVDDGEGHASAVNHFAPMKGLLELEGFMYNV